MKKIKKEKVQFSTWWWRWYGFWKFWLIKKIRLDLVKLSIENNLNSLLNNVPEMKVGIVSFGSEIEVKGDCLSNTMKIKEKDMENEFNKKYNWFKKSFSLFLLLFY